MTPKKLARIKREMQAMRRSARPADDFERLARQLGRKLNTSHGKHPMWESEFDFLFPLSIPRHGGRDLATGTKHSILDQLEEDVNAWEAILVDDNDEDDGDENGAE